MSERRESPDVEREREGEEGPASYAKVGLEEAGVGFLNALGDGLGLLLERGQRELEVAAQTGRSQYELRQLRRDKEVLFTKLGREVRRLVEAGELLHPALGLNCERIQDIDARIRDIEQDLAAAKGAQGEPGEKGDE